MKKIGQITDVPIAEFLATAAEPVVVVKFPNGAGSLRCPVYSGEAFETTLRRLRQQRERLVPPGVEPTEAFLLGHHDRMLWKRPLAPDELCAPPSTGGSGKHEKGVRP